jgi:hypothetical protein
VVPAADPVTIQIDRVPPKRGWKWLTAAFLLFRRHPALWLALSAIYTTIVIAASSNLFLAVISALANPALVAGFMVGCRAQEQGEELELAHLFAGFKGNLLQLVTVGSIYLSGLLIISLVVYVLGGDAIQAMESLGQNPDPAAVAELTGPILFAAGVGTGLLTPLLMAYWFAPALVHFHGLKALPAMAVSLRACLANLWPFLVYALSLFAVTVLGVTLLQVLLPFLFKQVLVMFWLITFLLVPLIMPSTYVSYRDLFPASDPRASTAPAEETAL